MSGCKVGCQSTSTLTDARPGWVMLDEVGGSSLPVSVSIPLLVSHCSFACGTDHTSQLSVLQKTSAHSHEGGSEPVPSTRSEPVYNRPLTQEGKSARNLPMPAKGWDVTRHWWKCWLPWRAPSSWLPNVMLLSVELADNSAVGVSGRISATGR